MQGFGRRAVMPRDPFGDPQRRATDITVVTTRTANDQPSVLLVPNEEDVMNRLITVVTLLIYCLLTVVVVNAASPSGYVRTWVDAGKQWNYDVSTTDELLLCVNFAAIVGSMAHGRGDDDNGEMFADISLRFETELREMHDNDTAELLLNATTAVMLNTVELVGEPHEFEKWITANLHRCQDTAVRLENSDGELR